MFGNEYSIPFARLSKLIVILSLLSVFCNYTWADKTDLSTLSLEELSEVKISSVSMREESLRNSAAAVHVISSKDIARSNAQSIPELLRTVPGLHVARIDSSNWAISSRGLNGSFNNRMLVLIDGRTVYTPIFGGVFWQVQDTPLEDIERIEVILGPGASTWGANAINGVINIITKSAAKTVGSMFSTSLSNEGQTVTARHGFEVDQGASLRTYARGRFGDNFERSSGGDAYDGYGLGQIGYRYDRRVGKNQFSSSADWYAGNLRLAVTDVDTPSFMEVSEVSDVAGGNLLNKYTHHYSDGGKLHAQIFFDKNQRYDTVAFNSVSTYDGTMQYDLPSFDSHDVTVGVGYRYLQTSLRPFRILQSVDPDNSQHSVNAFVQDQISLRDDLKLTLGTKFDHPEFVGAQWQPTARLGWELDKNISIWGAVSRAARIPTLANNSIQISNPLPLPDGSFAPAQVLPNRLADSENVYSYEAGLRSTVANWMSIDTSMYFNKYSNLTNYILPYSVSNSFSNSGVPFIPITSADDAQIESYGIEISSNFRFLENLSLKTWYTNLNVNTLNLSGSYPSDISGYEKLSASNQGYLRLDWDISDRYSLSPSIRYVDSVPEFSVPSYIAGGFKFTYSPKTDMQISLGAENLFAPSHVEYQSDFVLLPRTQIPTFGYVSFKVDF